MSRYIDAEEFLADESEAYISAQFKIEDEATRDLNSLVHKKIQMLIACAPAADAVVVVRCKDCKHYHVYCGTLPKMKHPWDCGACDAWDNLTTDENGFCFCGERKEE